MKQYSEDVIPAKAGIQDVHATPQSLHWIPAFAGMTSSVSYFDGDEVISSPVLRGGLVRVDLDATESRQIPGRLMYMRLAQALLATMVMSACATTPRHEATRATTHDTPSIWPLASGQGRITQVFGAQRGHHTGVDIAAPKGTPVIATADGIVYFAGRDNAYGRIVRIAHARGIETWYAHLRSIEVKRSRKVKQGQVIGKVGASGRATGPHLHYCVRVNGAPVDPRRYLPK